MGPQYGNENDDKRVEEICEEKRKPDSDRVEAMEGPIPRLSTILEDILACIAKLEAPEPQQEIKQETLTAAFNTLRGDVNILLEENHHSYLRRQTRPILAIQEKTIKSCN